MSHQHLEGLQRAPLYSTLDDQVVPREGKMSVNDYLQPITDTRQIKRMKFDPDSPRFSEACSRLAIDMRDIARKKLSEFE